MKITYYLEFFVENLIDVIQQKNIKKLSFPTDLRTKKLRFKSIVNDENYCFTVYDLLNELKIPFEFTNCDINYEKELTPNFIQEYVEVNKVIKKNLNAFKKDNVLEYYVQNNNKNVFSPIKGTYGKDKNVQFIISEIKPEKPYLIFFSAYYVDYSIWTLLYNILNRNYNILIFDGNYGEFEELSDSINKVLCEKKVKSAIAVTWCSGFKVFAKYFGSDSIKFRKIISLTGNYNNVQGEGTLSVFEKSLIEISKIIQKSNYQQLDKVFTYLFSKKSENLFGIPENVYEIISKQFLKVDYLKKYLLSTVELYNYDLFESLKKVDIPMINIIASNDNISSFNNNILINSLINDCDNIMINFATHWCLWTHAKQIALIIDKEIKETL